MSSEHSCTLHIKQSNFQGKLGELGLLPGMFPQSQSLFLPVNTFPTGPGSLSSTSAPPPLQGPPVWLHWAQDEEGHRPLARARPALFSSPLCLMLISPPHRRWGTRIGVESQPVPAPKRPGSKVTKPLLPPPPCCMPRSFWDVWRHALLCLTTKLGHCTAEVFFALSLSLAPKDL